jgi:hypothetical protein
VMGDAKCRGTEEQRKAKAIERRAAETEILAKAERIRWDLLTREQQEAEVKERERSKEAAAQLRQMRAMIPQRFPR